MKIVLGVLICFHLSSIELDLFYHHPIAPSTPREMELVSHVRSSFEKALHLQSKLTGKLFLETRASAEWRKPLLATFHPLTDIAHLCSYHFLNNVCALEGAAHLHVGLLAGDSFIAALYGNQGLLKEQIGIDWCLECSQEIMLSNCKKYLNMDQCRVVNCSCFDLDKSLFQNPIDIYFYDADHSLLAHQKAFTYYDDLFADVFVAIVDDWNCPWIRKPTFKAFEKLGYQILYEEVIQDGNGQYVAVIKKKNLN